MRCLQPGDAPEDQTKAKLKRIEEESGCLRPTRAAIKKYLPLLVIPAGMQRLLLSGFLWSSLKGGHLGGLPCSSGNLAAGAALPCNAHTRHPCARVRWVQH